MFFNEIYRIQDGKGRMQKKTTIKALRSREELTAWFMLAPNTIGLIVFVFLPVISAFVISFNDYNALNAMTFVGLKNFRELLNDRFFSDSLFRTFKYAIMYVPANVVFSILFATLIHSMVKRPQEIARTLVFFPYCISAVISGLMWKFLFGSPKGYINKIILLLGGSRQLFFGSMKQALPCIAVTAFWINIGYNMVIMLAAIKDIPQEYFESASIEGANAIQKFIWITLPHLRYAVTFILVMSTISSFQVFDQVKVITQGSPNRATQVTVYYIFDIAFTQYRLGYASALAAVFAIILFTFSFIQLKVMTRHED
jgi:multiple sugar transport system permease protein